MSRSRWKPSLFLSTNYKNGLQPSLEKKSVDQGTLYREKAPFLVLRSTLIFDDLVGETFRVHNGKGYTNVKVQEKMIGKKFGEFALTRRIAKHQVKKIGKKKGKK